MLSAASEVMSTATSEVRFARIDVDNTGSAALGTWNLTAQLPYPVYLHATAASNEHIYVIGGFDGEQGLYSNVLRAPFLANGFLGPWQIIGQYPSVSPDFSGVDLLEALVIDDRLYVLGGWDGQAKNPLTNVFYADIVASGIGPWQPTENLKLPTARFAVAYHNGYVYSTGGSYDIEDAPDAQYKEVYFAKVNSNGSLGEWTLTASLDLPVYYHQAVIHDGNLVILGGRSNEQVYSRILTSAIRSDGSLAGWTTHSTAMPGPLYRFAAVSLERSLSDYIYLIGGLDNDDNYRDNVYHSDVPPTLTPTPTPGINLFMSNDPKHWVAPGEQVEYQISLTGNQVAEFSDVRLRNTIPDQTELIVDSISAAGSYTYTGENAGSVIEWRWPNFDADGQETVSYRVRRKLPPTPDVTPVMSIDMVGPATAAGGDPIRYVLTVKNNLPIALPNVIAEDVVPLGATYVSGGDGPPNNGVVLWSIPSLAPFQSIDLELIVTADQTVVNSRFSVRTENGAYIQGQDVVVTVVDDTPPPPSGDGTAIINRGATIGWTAAGQQGGSESNSVRNPMFDVFLPVVPGR